MTGTQKEVRDRILAQKQEFVDAIASGELESDNYQEILDKWDAILEREVQIVREKQESEKNQKRKREQAIKEGRYNPDGTPTKQEIKILEARRAKNRQDWANKVGKNPNRERCPQR